MTRSCGPSVETSSVACATRATRCVPSASTSARPRSRISRNYARHSRSPAKTAMDPRTIAIHPRKEGPGKPRRTPKGRPLDPVALADVGQLLGDAPRRADLLIEHLHRLQDRYGHLSAAHLAALAHEMKLAQAEVYEVATFYHHFDVVREGENAPPKLTVRVCESLSCELAGAHQLLAK